MKINLTLNGQHYLIKLVMTDLKRMDDLADHAAAHGSEVYLPEHATANVIKLSLLKDTNAKS